MFFEHNDVHGRNSCNFSACLRRGSIFFVTWSCISKTIRLQCHHGVFQWHKFEQKNFELVFLTSLMGCVESFKVLSINALGHLTSSSLLSRWTNLGWIHQHSIIKCYTSLICIVIWMIIINLKQLWGISRIIHSNLWRFG
jgi:hypothetical protein